MSFRYHDSSGCNADTNKLLEGQCISENEIILAEAVKASKARAKFATQPFHSPTAYPRQDTAQEARIGSE